MTDAAAGCPTLFGEADPAVALFERLRLFGGFDAATQMRLLSIAIRNDLRILDAGDSQGRQGALDAGLQLHRELRDERWAGDPLTSETWMDAALGFPEAITGGLPRAIARSAFLAARGLCPLLHLAFGTWCSPDGWPGAAVDLTKVAELSVCYLLRAVPVASPLLAGAVVGQGAYSVVVRDVGSLARVLKVPRNMAGRAFMNGAEATVLRRLKGTALEEHVPVVYNYDPRTGIIERSYIPGHTGDEVLAAGGMTASLVVGLKRAYRAIEAACAALDVALDMHPANLVWRTDVQRWFLVDVGPVPAIGSDYYPRQGFDAYYKKVWLDRREHMRTTPIRSVDISSS